MLSRMIQESFHLGKPYQVIQKVAENMSLVLQSMESLESMFDLTLNDHLQSLSKLVKEKQTQESDLRSIIDFAEKETRLQLKKEELRE